MHACLGTLLPEDRHGNAFDGLLVCLSTCIDQHASGAENEDTPVPGSKSTEVGCIASLHLTVVRVVLDVWDLHIGWIHVNRDVFVHGCTLLEKQFASHSSPPALKSLRFT